MQYIYMYFLILDNILYLLLSYATLVEKVQVKNSFTTSVQRKHRDEDKMRNHR